jgi:hypothetical protein
MGSGAFLVQACRWLGERLVEAWERAGADTALITPEGAMATGAPIETTVPADSEERRALARRLIADRCLYGVDVNPLAVEMAKLSIWLVTLAKGRPFSFLDHALKCGDSLLGVHDLDQVRFLHLVPERGREIHATLFDPGKHIDAAIAQALKLRHRLERFAVLDVRDAEQKADLDRAARAALDRVRAIADLVVDAALLTAGSGVTAFEAALVRIADELGLASSTTQELPLLAGGLDGPPGHLARRRPFHWPIEFPEVFTGDRPGFHALISNPPFRGGVALARTFGERYERFLKFLVPESRGFVDLAAYFHRRAQVLTGSNGIVGLLGPQNLVTSANRRASTDAIVRSGRRIAWARRKIRWPGTASLYVCIIGYMPGGWSLTPELDGLAVKSISASLDAEVDLSPASRLPRWVQYSQGTDLYGASFVKSVAEWDVFVEREPAVQMYLRPYVNADILCSYPQSQTDLLAVDFGERDKDELQAVPMLVEHLEASVGQERSQQTRQIHESRPWLHWDKRLRTYEAARRSNLVLACPRVSKHLPMLMVDSSVLFGKSVKFFPGAGYGVYALLQATAFRSWAFATSPLRGDVIEFSTRSSLDTYVPPPNLDEGIEKLGAAVWQRRLEAMVARDIGITGLLNLVNDEGAYDEDISQLRELEVDLDHAVMAAYGWDDIRLDHNFDETRQGMRFTVTAAARTQMLERLLQWNHDRAEAASGQTVVPPHLVADV